ncbi:ABC transporter ATP-binding protein [Pyrodictium delaneyi]|uniref:ABC transporter ATP-binding protein n=1 Tax=Pyrodictium delaneyi TaxID=1273541 RepID=A0A0P0N2Y8_9CREN|nr:ABC transporter ATP-binding protein [Pyrodictium delaneyi]OWJ54213.1 ABC transporter ATP-binding protein [Pyrodictium delaneyi]
MDSRRPVLELVDVVKVYRAGEVVTWGLRGLSLRVYRSEFIAIMGPSGSGKTTLLNIAGLLDRPTRGKVYIEGVDVSRLSDHWLARLRNRYIGFVFQQFNLINRLTVLENIELPLIPRGIPRQERRKRAIKALLSVGGDVSWLPKKPLQLSGGQQQRVAIARAIVGGPYIILADEPTGALDRRTARLVIETFVKLNKRGQTIMVVTHDPEVANCAHKIYQIRDGKIAGIKEPDPSRCILSTVKP